jgi:hypothetical protein
MENLIAWGLTTLTSAFVGSYLAGYLKKKGENLATKEDVQDLAAQTALLTQTTEQIKAEITDKVWNKQRHWEMKRDAIFAAIQGLERANSAVISMATVFNHAPGPDDDKEGVWATRKTDAMILCRDATNEFDDRRAIATLVCSPELSSALSKASWEIRAAVSKVFENYATQYGDISKEITTSTVVAYNLARKGVEYRRLTATSQSSGSSASPTPVYETGNEIHERIHKVIVSLNTATEYRGCLGQSMKMKGISS